MKSIFKKNNNGFSLIELIITITILGIISGIFYSISKTTLDMHEKNYADSNAIFAIQNISRQITDEIKHSVNISSNSASNLNLFTYDSPDTSGAAGITTQISYNLINNKLFKYNGRLGDTGSFNINFDTVSFYIDSTEDSLANIIFETNNKKKFFFKISKRN